MRFDLMSQSVCYIGLFLLGFLDAREETSIRGPFALLARRKYASAFFPSRERGIVCKHPIRLPFGKECSAHTFLLVREHSSVVERCPDKTEALGSIPSARTRLKTCTAAGFLLVRETERCFSFRKTASRGRDRGARRCDESCDRTKTLLLGGFYLRGQARTLLYVRLESKPRAM